MIFTTKKDVALIVLKHILVVYVLNANAKNVVGILNQKHLENLIQKATLKEVVK